MARTKSTSWESTLNIGYMVQSFFTSKIIVKESRRGCRIHLLLLLETCEKQNYNMVSLLFKKLDQLLEYTLSKGYGELFLSIDCGNNNKLYINFACDIINFKYNDDRDFRQSCKFDNEYNKVKIYLY